MSFYILADRTRADQQIHPGVAEAEGPAAGPQPLVAEGPIYRPQPAAAGGGGDMWGAKTETMNWSNCDTTTYLPYNYQQIIKSR